MLTELGNADQASEAIRAIEQVESEMRLEGVPTQQLMQRYTQAREWLKAVYQDVQRGTLN